MSIWNGFDEADVEIHMDEIAAEGADFEREYREEAEAEAAAELAEQEA